MTAETLLTIGGVAAGVTLSGLFSGMETGVYALNRVRLVGRVAEGHRAARRLHRELESPGRLLASLLVATNAATYLATWCVARLLHESGLGPWSRIALEAAVVTPVLFVLAETLPKDLFRTHTDRWSYTLSWIHTTVRRGCTWLGLVPLVHGIELVMGVLFGSRRSTGGGARQRILQFIREGAGAGLFTRSQAMLADRAMALRDLWVGSEMIPWSEVVTVPEGLEGDALREHILRHPYTRCPVVAEDGTVTGVLHVLEALLADDPASPAPVSAPCLLHSDSPVREAMERMRQERRSMAIVVDAHRRPRGIVTLKDLVEPLTGELTDW